jgi:hypothetical protein
LLDCERLKSKNLRPRHERAVHIKERIVGGRSDETKSPCLDVGQENVLLRLVKMMNLINKQDRLSPGCAQAIGGGSNDTTHLGDIAFDAADPDKFCVRHLRDDSSSVVLPLPGGPEKITEGKRSASIARRNSLPGARMCS